MERVIQISNAQIDPLEPPKHKVKKVPRGTTEAPPVIMRSPPRQLTRQEDKDWKVPASISNWKNASGYTVPLHMRLQADGRGMQDTQINERHAVFADSLYAAERLARKETAERAKMHQSIRLAQAEKKEEQIRKMAILAKAEKAQLLNSSLKEEQEAVSGVKKDSHYGPSST